MRGYIIRYFPPWQGALDADLAALAGLVGDMLRVRRRISKAASRCMRGCFPKP
jgi:hypothetical protein